MPSLEGEKDPKLLVGAELDVGRKGPETREKSRVGSWRVSPGNMQGAGSARPRCPLRARGGGGDPEAYEWQPHGIRFQLRQYHLPARSRRASSGYPGGREPSWENASAIYGGDGGGPHLAGGGHDGKRRKAGGEIEAVAFRLSFWSLRQTSTSSLSAEQPPAAVQPCRPAKPPVPGAPGVWPVRGRAPSRPQRQPHLTRLIAVWTWTVSAWLPGSHTALCPLPRGCSCSASSTLRLLGVGRPCTLPSGLFPMGSPLPGTSTSVPPLNAIGVTLTLRAVSLGRADGSPKPQLDLHGTHPTRKSPASPGP